MLDEYSPQLMYDGNANSINGIVAGYYATGRSHSSCWLFLKAAARKDFGLCFLWYVGRLNVTLGTG